ncbi:MAG TPA: DUF6527 family protein [Candidatus Saccharimonadales bacterium]|nr:DUF6527 family protein [Candidatus Saccharimonadales bacterium]
MATNVTRDRLLRHEFVEYIPDVLEDGVLYISTPYSTAVHLCMCGCGQEVVTPLSPQQWQLKSQDDTVSLTPSVGNWSFACQSHYWIRNSRIVWDKQFSKKAIMATREARAANIRHSIAQSEQQDNKLSVFNRILRWISGKLR